jgi:hypothetical protein
MEGTQEWTGQYIFNDPNSFNSGDKRQKSYERSRSKVYTTLEVLKVPFSDRH